MGILYSFTKKPLADQLEEVEKAINSVWKNRSQSEQRQKRMAAQVTLWSIFSYLLISLSFLAYYFPSTLKKRLLYATPLLFTPVLVYCLRRLVLLYFSQKIKSANDELKILVEKKKNLLEQVREKESYKKAKEILEKYDPEVINMKKMEEKMRSQSANSQLRQRVMPNVPGANPQGIPLARGARPIPNSPPPHNAGSNTAPGSPALTPHRTPIRPLPAAFSGGESMTSRGWGLAASGRKSTFDRMMEMMLGDGPSNKYALICVHCLNHNGMALKEEFEFIAFRCAYCGFANPAKKARPVPPRLPNLSTPESSLLKPKPTDQEQPPTGGAGDESSPENGLDEEGLEGTDPVDVTPGQNSADEEEGDEENGVQKQGIEIEENVPGSLILSSATLDQGSAVVEVNDGNGEKQVAGQEALDEEVIEADKTLKENHSLFRNETHLEDFVDPANIERSSSEASDDSSLVNQSSNQNLPHVELISNQNTDECKMAESEQTTANQNPDSLLPDLIQNS